LYSALATLPALESVKLAAPPEGETTLDNPEILTELVRVPTLWNVSISELYFTRSLCQATANALMEGTAITNLEFIECSFFAGESVAIMAIGLSRNTSVLKFEVVSKFDEAFNGALAAALPSNRTLQELSFEVLPANLSLRQLKFDFPLEESDHSARLDWSPILSALEKNTRLQTLSVDMYNSMDESLCTAMKDGLGRNATLKHLKLNNVVLYDDSAALWSRAFSFLRTNKTLKSLTIDATDSFFASLLSDIACMLQDNASLESLCILGWPNTEADDYIALVTALKHNRTLKTLYFDPESIGLIEVQDKEMAALLKKNYALESLPEMVAEKEGDAGAFLRLNRAGRRYLIEDGSSVSKGIEVLSAVSRDINCVFLHLLENPTLCDRSAVDSASDSTSNHNSESTSPVKREHGQAENEGKKSRRRMT
jgi:hypothetical protein